jgi:Transglycosylase SLT domain
MRLFAIVVLAVAAHQWYVLADAPRIEEPKGSVATHLAVALKPSGRAFNWRSAQNAAVTAPSQNRSSTVANTVVTVCQMLQTAARANGLPLDFLARLIWQESRFRAFAVSPAGAQGVAQFMPKTADDVGLSNPFDMPDAIAKSAALLRNLKNQFGNWGLAAAAYNAGPRRVQEWLASRGNLPAETRAYVRIITGRPVATWTVARSSPSGMVRAGIVPADGIPCPQLVKKLATQSSPPLFTENPISTTVSASRNPSWGVQLLGDSSRLAVLMAYHHLQTRFRMVLANRQPVVIRSKVGRTGYWFRLRIAVDSLHEAEKLCTSLREAGGSCLVQHNY